MTTRTIPDPAPGQVWEDRYGGSYTGRRVRILPADPTSNRFRCEVVEYPQRPERVGSVVSLARGTIRTKWRFIEAPAPSRPSVHDRIGPGFPVVRGSGSGA